MIPKCVLVLFASLFFRGECVPEDVVPSVEVPPTLPSATDVFAVPGKGEKLEEEIDKIGKDMQPDTGVVQEELRIHDEFDLRQKLENFTVPKLTTTEKSAVKEQDPPIDGDGLEQEEAAHDPGDDGEHIRHPSEHDFGEFGDTLKDKKHSEPRVEEEIQSPANPKPPETPASSPEPEQFSTVSPEKSAIHQEEHLIVKPEKPHVSEIGLTGISSGVQTEIIPETRYPGKGSEIDTEARGAAEHEVKETDNSEVEPSEHEEVGLAGPPRPPPRFEVDGVRHPETDEFDPSEIREDQVLGRSTSIRGGSEYQDWRRRPEKSEIDLSGVPEVGLPGIPGKDGAQFHTSDLGVKSDKLETELSGIPEVGLPGIPSETRYPGEIGSPRPTLKSHIEPGTSATSEASPKEKPDIPDISFSGISTKVGQEISETRYPGKPEPTDEEPVGPPRPPPRSKTVKPKKPEDVYPGPPGAADVDGPRIPSREGPEFQDPDRRKSEISSADIQGVDHPDIPVRPTDESEEEKYVPKVVDGIHDPRDFDREAIEGAKEMARRDEIEEEEEEEDWIKWDLVHFLLLLSPYDKDEVTWWTIIFEAVKCSLRSCPQAKPHWHGKKLELPRVNRHRREDSEFDPEAVVQTTPKPCACQNLENYFEKLYESIGDKNKTRSSSSNNSTVIVNN